MSASIHAQISATAKAHPVGAAIVTAVACVAVILLLIQEVFAPVGKRRPPPGKKWKLPPGPPGIPIFGSLLLLRNVRSDQDFKLVRAHPRI